MSYNDNRPDVVSQIKLQKMADNSPGVKQLQTYQKMADEHTKTPENNSNGEVTQLMGTGLFGRFARPMARGAARLGKSGAGGYRGGQAYGSERANRERGVRLDDGG